MSKLSLRCEVRDRIAAAVAQPSGALVAAGAIVAVVVGAPLVWSIVSLLNTENQTISLDAEDSLVVVSSRMAQESLGLFWHTLWAILVVIPISYGGAFVALAAIRGQAARVRDVLAPYRRPVAFCAISLVLGVLTFVPVMLWLVAAVGVGVIIGVAMGMSGEDPTDNIPLIVTMVVAVGIPFLMISLYFQFRFLFAGLVLLDDRCKGVGALSALAQSWRLTRKQNGPLTPIALVAVWEVVRGLSLGLIVGLFRRGMPRFLALFSGSYEVLVVQGAASEQR